MAQYISTSSKTEHVQRINLLQQLARMKFKSAKLT